MNSDEYRYLTFLFCDLVGSTPLSQELDHEDWRFVLGQFKNACLERVQEQGGTVHECQGDGFLFYFGYPVAYEDSAQRAINAAMAIIDDCQSRLIESTEVLKPYSQPGLRVRSGIHSGKVVIGTVDGVHTATGFPLAYTVRLHELAEPNQIVISDATRHLVTNHFRLQDMGYARLKGIDYPVAYHEVVSRKHEEHNGRESTVFVSRQDEKAQLLKRWTQAASGRGESILVQGEAGIGKSRLLQEIIGDAVATGAQVLLWRCLSHAQSIALNPLLEGFTRLVSDYAESNAHERAFLPFNPLEAQNWLRVLTDPEYPIPSIQENTSAESKSHINVGKSSSEKRKHASLIGLADWLVLQSTYRPLLLVLEDLHWIDPSTLDFLTLLSQRLNGSSLLLLMSRRREPSDNWRCPFPASELHLNRFSNIEACALVRSLSGAEHLSDEIIARLIQRSDGVPLFIEESAAMLIDNDDIESTAQTKPQKSAAPVLEHSIPSRLMDLLTARLDQTGDARRTAGLAASIGRGFNEELLFAVSDKEPTVLVAHLDALLSKGLLQWENEKQRLLTFKHELVRDAAYSTLLQSTRRLYHSKIAQALESGEHSKGAVEPEILAYHFAEAGMIEHSVDCWLRAARKARLNSNPVEATTHYAQVSAMLARWTEVDEVIAANKKLDMLTGLGACHIALKGYGSDEARVCFESAETVAQRLGKNDKVMRIRFGLEAYCFMRGDFQKAQAISQSCFDMASAELDGTTCDNTADELTKAKLSLAQSCWALGNVYFHKGDFNRSIPLLKKCTQLCEFYENSAIQLVHKPNIMSQLYCAWHQCESGEMDRALETVEHIVRKARGGGHAYTMCVALAFNACIHLFRGEYQTAIGRAEESIRLSEEPGFVTWLAWAKVLRGRCFCEDRFNRAKGLAEIQEGIELWDNSGSIVTRPFALALQAESLWLDGDLTSAWRSIEKSQETMEIFGERYFEAEIFRIKGVLCKAKNDHEQAEQCFQRSIQFARNRDMWRSVMRSSIELVRMQRHRTIQFPALHTLQSARAEIAGGHHKGSDLIIADQLIEQLSDQS